MLLNTSMISFFSEIDADKIVNNVLNKRRVMEDMSNVNVERDFITKDNDGNIVRVLKAERLQRDELLSQFEIARDALEAYDALSEIEAVEVVPELAQAATEHTPESRTEVPEEVAPTPSVETATPIEQPAVGVAVPIQPVQIPIQ